MLGCVAGIKAGLNRWQLGTALVVCAMPNSATLTATAMWLSSAWLAPETLGHISWAWFSPKVLGRATELMLR